MSEDEPIVAPLPDEPGYLGWFVLGSGALIVAYEVFQALCISTDRYYQVTMLLHYEVVGWLLLAALWVVPRVIYFTDYDEVLYRDRLELRRDGMVYRTIYLSDVRGWDGHINDEGELVYVVLTLNDGTHYKIVHRGMAFYDHFTESGMPRCAYTEPRQVRDMLYGLIGLAVMFGVFAFISYGPEWIRDSSKGKELHIVSLVLRLSPEPGCSTREGSFFLSFNWRISAGMAQSPRRLYSRW